MFAGKDGAKLSLAPLASTLKGESSVYHKPSLWEQPWSQPECNLTSKYFSIKLGLFDEGEISTVKSLIAQHLDEEKM